MDNRTRILLIGLYAAATAAASVVSGPTLPRLLKGLIRALEEQLGIGGDAQAA